jgi:ribose transport system permease protein
MGDTGNAAVDAPPVAPPDVSRLRRRQRLAKLAQGQGPALMLVLVVVHFGTQSGFFFTISNAVTVGSSSAALGIMAVAQTYLIISGDIDVSVGSVVALSTVTCGLLILRGDSSPWPLGAMLVGAPVGALNALLVAVLKINLLVATLGTMSVFSGVAFTLTRGQTRVVDNPALVFIGTDSVLGIPVPLVAFLIVLALAVVVEKFTSWGRTVYAIGGNAEAARLAGLRVGTPSRCSMCSPASRAE